MYTSGTGSLLLGGKTRRKRIKQLGIISARAIESYFQNILSLEGEREISSVELA